METIVETVEKTKNYNCEKNKLYSVEEVLEYIDNKFIDFYGEYGSKIVNDRRSEWKQNDIVNLKML